MRLISGTVSSAALAVAIIGCGGAPAGPTLAPGQTATPAPPAGSTAAPGTTGHECDAVPTFSINNPAGPSFPPDTVAESHFPATIDGQPVTDVHSQQWIYFLCYLGGQAQYDQAAGQSGGGVNLATSSFAQARATVDGERLDLNAWRTPGADANQFVQHLGFLMAQAGGGTLNTSEVQSGNVGGKNVYFWPGANGTKGYAYASGDSLVFFNNVTDSQATKILQALP